MAFLRWHQSVTIGQISMAGRVNMCRVTSHVFHEINTAQRQARAYRRPNLIRRSHIYTTTRNNTRQALRCNVRSDFDTHSNISDKLLIPVVKATYDTAKVARISNKPYSSTAVRYSSYGPGQGPDESPNKDGRASEQPIRRLTIADLHKLYLEKTKISMLTAFDAMSGNWCDRNNIDMILVGDSLAMVALGYESTTEITLEEMFHHSRAVARGTKRSFLIGDMPFGSYQASPEEAARNAIRFIKEANVQAVKLEGGEHMCPAIEKVVGCGVPVLGHIGLTPQSVNVLGGFKVQGKTADSAQQLVKDALALQKAGCFAIVIEAVPSPIAEYITSQISIPTIGIGAGPHTSGQVLVTLDMLGVFDRFTPKFCRQYAQLASTCHDGLKKYIDDVRQQHKANM